MMICLLSDITDYRLIQMGQFVSKIATFDPFMSLEFIVRMFSSQAEI